MPITDDLYSNQTSKYLTIDQTVYASWKAISLSTLEEAFQINTSIQLVILKELPPSICTLFFPILLKSKKEIHLENMSYNALNKIYGICQKYPEKFAVTCSNQEWNSKFAQLNTAKTQLATEQKSTPPLYKLLSLNSSGVEHKADEKQQINTKEKREKAEKLMDKARQLANAGKELRDLYNDSKDDAFDILEEIISKSSEKESSKYINWSLMLLDRVIKANFLDLQAEAFKLKSILFHELSRRQEAIKNFELALKLKPNDFDVICYLSLEYAANKQFKKGLDLLINKAEFFPQHKMQISLTRAFILAGAGELLTAADEISKIISQITVQPSEKSVAESKSCKAFEYYVSQMKTADIDKVGIFYEACWKMADIQAKLNNPKVAIKFDQMAKCFKQQYKFLGGTFTKCDIPIPDKVADEKDTPIVHHTSVIDSVDDVTLRLGDRVSIWDIPVSSTYRGAVTELTPYGKELLRSGKFLKV